MPSAGATQCTTGARKAGAMMGAVVQTPTEMQEAMKPDF